MRAHAGLDTPLLFATIAIIFSLVGGFALFPEQTNDLAGHAFRLLTSVFGAPLQLIVFLAVFFLLFLAFSKYGNIRLGTGEPEYSIFSWISMMICCGISSAMLFWAFTDWAYDFGLRSLAPFMGVASAYEMGTAYTFFHWGFSTWGIYCISALPIAYYFFVRHHDGLSLSAVFEAVRVCGKNRARAGNPASRFIDLLFLVSCCTGISIALGLSVPMLTELTASFFGFTPSFALNMGILLAISALFTISSWRGIASGMQTMSRLSIWLVFLLVALVFLLGDAQFMVKSTVNGIGLVIQNFIRMSLWTDPVLDGGFSEKWTVWYWFYDISFTPFVGLFVTRISRGRTVRALIFNMLGSGSAGAFAVFGVLSHHSVACQMSGAVDVIKLIEQGQMNSAVVDVLNTLPASSLLVIIFGAAAALLLCTSLDSAAYTMAATLTPGLPADRHPLARHRFLCCLLLVSVPVAMLLTHAPLETLKTFAILSGVPLAFVLGYVIYGFIRSMSADFGAYSAEEIKAMQGESPVPRVLTHDDSRHKRVI